ENTESESTHCGHGTEPLVRLDQRLGLGQRDRSDLGAADIDGGGLRTCGRKLFSDDALMCLARQRRDLAALAIGALSATCCAVPRVRSLAERDPFAANLTFPPLRQARGADAPVPARSPTRTGAIFRVAASLLGERSVALATGSHGTRIP